MERKQTEIKTLIVCYSYGGNTRRISEMIRAKTGADIVEIETVTSYTGSYDSVVEQDKREAVSGFEPEIKPRSVRVEDYDTLVAQAKEEQAADARPAISTQIENITDYDVIYLGFPNWWGTTPMIVNTFLEQYNLAGKTIIPFCTHEGSALGRSVEDIKALSPDANVLEGLAVRGSAANAATAEVSAFIESVS